MKKIFSITIIIFILIHEAKSQGGGAGGIITQLSQRSTILYTDTVFELEQLQFKVTETYAFRNKIKTTLIITNLSDNFKILHSEDFTITDSENNPIGINQKKTMVIAPKTTKKFGLLAESKSFKLHDIKVSLKQIYSASTIETIINPNLFNLHLEGTSSSKAGPLEVTTIKCIAAPDGTTKAYFKLSYTGNKFLAIYGSKAMLQTASRKGYMNIAKKSKITYYPNDKAALTMMLEFDNSSPNFFGENCDKVSFENVFIEYSVSSSNNPFVFHIYKNGETKDDSPPKEKKETETTED